MCLTEHMRASRQNLFQKNIKKSFHNHKCCIWNERSFTLCKLVWSWWWAGRWTISLWMCLWRSSDAFEWEMEEEKVDPSLRVRPIPRKWVCPKFTWRDGMTAWVAGTTTRVAGMTTWLNLWRKSGRLTPIFVIEEVAAQKTGVDQM